MVRVLGRPLQWDAPWATLDARPPSYRSSHQESAIAAQTRANTREQSRSRARLHKYPVCSYNGCMPRPKTFEKDRVTKAIRISPDLNDALSRLADERQVSVNLVITWALQDYLGAAKGIDEIKRAV